MLLLEHFNSEFNIYPLFLLKEGELKTLLDKLPSIYRRCYISDSKLEESLTKLPISREEIIGDRIPNDPVVMSGEFSEIFSTYFLIDKYEKDLNIILDHPNKLFWKEGKNKALHFTDVLLFSNMVGITDSEDDLLISGEIKSKATKNNSYDPIQDAIDGVINDKISRLAYTLDWVKEKFTADINNDGLTYINRYRLPHRKSYKKHFKAVIVIDKEFLTTEIEKERTPLIKESTKKIKRLMADFISLGITIQDKKIINFHKVTEQDIIDSEAQNKDEILDLYKNATLNFEDNSEILVISIDQLKYFYEETFKKIPSR